jgi:mannose-6-phosphate isomerase-like protein (cupin superfamily)
MSEPTILFDDDALVATWSVYEPGESGPETHVHHEHNDCFWVLEGSLVFEIGPDGKRIKARAGTFVAVPPLVAHTFRNEGPGAARFLNFHAPGKGFGEALRKGEDFDSDDPPAGGGRSADDAVVVSPEPRTA